MLQNLMLHYMYSKHNFVTKVVPPASFLGECFLKMRSFLYLENVTKFDATLYELQTSNSDVSISNTKFDIKKNSQNIS